MTPEAEQNAMLERHARNHGIGHDACGADCPRPDCCEACIALAFGRELLQAVQERDRWISVEERLPDEGDWNLICFAGDEIVIGIYSCGDWYRAIDNVNLSKLALEVTHWRPLPKPPGEAQTYADLFQEEK